MPISMGTDGKDVALRVGELTDTAVSTSSSVGRNPQFLVKPNIGMALDRLGLMTKHSKDRWLPIEFLRSSYHQRLDLLRGLMDTDGNVMTSGSTNYQTTSERLAENVADLVRSLGGWARITKNKTANRYRINDEIHFTGTWTWRVTVRLETNPFDCHRARAERWEQANALVSSRSHRSKLVKAVVPEGREQVRCIRVDAANSLFLTRYLTPTHNTMANFGEPAMFALQHSPQPRIYRRLLLANGAGEHVAGVVYTLLRKVKRTSTAKPPFYKRMTIEINDNDQAAYDARLIGTVEQLAITRVRLDDGADHRQAAFFNTGWWCSSCPFKLPCQVMQDNPAGAEAMLADLYTEGDPWARYMTDGNGSPDDSEVSALF
jgi:hypothetical protein